MSKILNQINTLLYPYVLGYWSENNGGNFAITNSKCTQLRAIGGRRWDAFTTSQPNIFNSRLEVVTYDFLNSGSYNTNLFFMDFLKRERIEDELLALKIIELCKPYLLALVGDLQGQYHYCLTKNDPLETNNRQKVSFIFPGTVFDIYDSLPKSEVTIASPLVGGSLGWLAHLKPIEKTLAGIEAAKIRLA